jgi:Protein of unknown function (DUF4232)
MRAVMSGRSRGGVAVLGLAAAVACGTGVAAAHTLGTHAAAATPRCLHRNLRLAAPQSNGAAGTIRLRFVFRNVGSATCSFFGYPGMQLVNKHGHKLATTVVRAPATPHTVLVAPGRRASFYAKYSDVPTGSQTCPVAASAQVWPPNDFQTLSAKLPFPAQVCGGRITVYPVVGGVEPL